MHTRPPQPPPGSNRPDGQTHDAAELDSGGSDRARSMPFDLAAADIGQADTARDDGLDTRVMRQALESRLFGRAPEPTTVGRFRLLEVLGRGGMGVVYAAHDPQLDRRVALKLLHRDDPERSGTPREELLREARALARLSHANVVTIFETGVHEGALFLAMEFLDGGTLAQWAAAHPVRTRADARSTLALYLRAGAGLAAAHAAGLVHRDFKPANVLRGEDGRLAVADFGLARGLPTPTTWVEGADDTEGSTDTEGGDQASGARRVEPDDPMTTATIAGTPAYMAPEQFDGRVDARSDQFSFCVALWEALLGDRPFIADTPAALRERMQERRPPTAPVRSPVPRSVQRALLRGLSIDPQQRFDSMDALLSALSRDRRRWVRRAALGAAVVGIVALVAVRPWWPEPSACDEPPGILDPAWGPERRAAVAAALSGSGSAFGLQTRERVEVALDRYARDWRAVRRERCEASLVRHERSAEAYDRTMHCLERRRDELAAVTEVLAAGDATVAERAVAAVAALSPVDACADVEALRRRAPEDPEQAAALADFERRLASIRTLLDTGQHESAMARMPALVQDARALGSAAPLAQALRLQGRGLWAEGRHAQARSAYEQALQQAATAGDDALAAELWPPLVKVVGKDLAQVEPAAALAVAADATLLRAGDPPADRAALHHALGTVARASQRLDEAEREHLAGLALRREHLADDSLAIADSLNRLAGVYHEKRELTAAEALMTEVVTRYQQVLGPGHPRVASVLHNLAGVVAVQGRYGDAARLYEQALAAREDVYGLHSISVARTLSNLSAVLARDGRRDEALAHLQRAMAIIEAERGPDDPLLASAYNNLGAIHEAAGRLEQSLHAQRQAIEVIERRGRGPSPALAISLSNLGLMQALLGRTEEAVASQRRSIEAYEALYGPEHPELWRPLALLARLHREAGRIEQALPLAERAVAVIEGHQLPPIEEADARFELAQVRWVAGKRDEITRRLAVTARDLWVGADGTAEATEVNRWLVERSLDRR